VEREDDKRKNYKETHLGLAGVEGWINLSTLACYTGNPVIWRLPGILPGVDSHVLGVSDFYIKPRWYGQVSRKEVVSRQFSVFS
jgi:hypothetical protein